ncbi:hypothetical protein [Arthrobacter silvisoli]|nr:hypothetical protein [Arthrobacter silvisoli]
MTVIAMISSLLVGVLMNVWFQEQIFFLIAALATFAVVTKWRMTLIGTHG